MERCTALITSGAIARRHTKADNSGDETGALCAVQRIGRIQPDMQGASPFAAFERHKYLSLETFRKNGQAVRTPVWFAGDPASGNAPKFYVYSEGNSGKAKRIRNNPRVRVAPCDMRGKVRGDFVEASAEIVTGAEAQHGIQLLNQKYFPWKQLLDFFSRFKRRGHDVFAIRPA